MDLKDSNSNWMAQNCMWWIGVWLCWNKGKTNISVKCILWQIFNEMVENQDL